MCGIAGIFHYGESMKRADPHLLARMAQRIAHRGPDDEGIFIDGSLGLANRRLAIVDITPTGHQPMVSQDGRFAITYNGEIYNHAEFRPQLNAQGSIFRGTSDTETLLHPAMARRLWPSWWGFLPSLFGTRKNND
jgi:asparagine synthase (glutamine-hydrolysing)